MAWTASIINKQVQDDLVLITVEYTDGQNVISKVYRSTKPNPQWIPDTARDTIERLEKAFGFDVVLGEVTPSDPIVIDPVVAQVRKTVRQFHFLKGLIDLGWVPENHPKIQDEKAFILANLVDYWDYI